ncbi:MAG TPA: methyltransferase domain-containing protein [Candidatus Dormibacteraeota bacterium]|nr:methyltransferase domain-containing protein [Candidatus Dormibacteraeota bacterium]
MSQAPDAATRWKDALASWAIPDWILAQAREDPWALPVALFESRQPDISPSHRRALEPLAAGGTVLDVGAGRCAMSLPLRPPAQRLIAVDSAPAMLENSPADITILGRWPDVAPQAGRASAVVCGHVLYNVADLMPFIRALNAAATRRVVIEITRSHPRNRPLERVLWRHFWNLERPEGPAWEDALAVIREAGIQPDVELWESEQRGGFRNLEELVSWMRRTVCLDRAREDEVRAIVLQHAAERDGLWRLSPEPRALTTLWWDVTQ